MLGAGRQKWSAGLCQQVKPMRGCGLEIHPVERLLEPEAIPLHYDRMPTSPNSQGYPLIKAGSPCRPPWTCGWCSGWAMALGIINGTRTSWPAHLAVTGARSRAFGGPIRGRADSRRGAGADKTVAVRTQELRLHQVHARPLVTACLIPRPARALRCRPGTSASRWTNESSSLGRWSLRYRGEPCWAQAQIAW